MKDQMFFIFTILYLTCSAWITDHKAPFCSVDKGTQLLYQIDSEQAERYYFQQTTEKIENTDSLSVIHYTGTLWDKKRTVVIPSFSFTTSCVQKHVNTYLPNFIHGKTRPANSPARASYFPVHSLSDNTSKTDI